MQTFTLYQSLFDQVLQNIMQYYVKKKKKQIIKTTKN